MCKHEEKQCPICRVSFECKPGNITQCQCFGIHFSENEKLLIGQTYTDCLCRQCLLQLKNEIASEQLTLQKTS